LVVVVEERGVKDAEEEVVVDIEALTGMVWIGKDRANVSSGVLVVPLTLSSEPLTNVPEFVVAQEPAAAEEGDVPETAVVGKKANCGTAF